MMQGKSKNFNSKGRFVKNEKNDEKSVVKNKDYNQAKNRPKKEAVVDISKDKEINQV